MEKMEIKADASQSNDGTQKGKEQVAVAAVVSISEGVFTGAADTALERPVGESGPIDQSWWALMLRRSEVRNLLLTTLLQDKLKPAFNISEAEVDDDAASLVVKLFGSLPGDTERLTLSMRVNPVSGDDICVVDLIDHLGLPEQPEVPEYDEFGMIDLIGELTGINTEPFDSIETGAGGTATMYQSVDDSAAVTGYLLTTFYLGFKGQDIRGMSEEELWSFLYTLKHHGELAALANLYRHYELA